MQENVKKLSFDELDNVAGGTWRETGELVHAYNKNRKKDRAISYTIEWHLRKIGIEAKTSWGFYGAGSVNNVYREKNTGKMLLHEEVIEFLRTGRKSW